MSCDEIEKEEGEKRVIIPGDVCLVQVTEFDPEKWIWRRKDGECIHCNKISEFGYVFVKQKFPGIESKWVGTCCIKDYTDGYPVNAGYSYILEAPVLILRDDYIKEDKAE